MLSRAQIKYIQSLQLNKFRTRYGVYLAEGEKLALDLLQSGATIQQVFATAPWIAEHAHQFNAPHTEIHTITEEELKKISSLSMPNKVLMVVGIPSYPMPHQLDNGLYVALENLQDPGNMGTIIRTADWFGCKGIICSENTVDAYNPKVVQATMGSIARMPIFYGDLESVIVSNTHLPAYAAVLEGENVYKAALQPNALLLIGNEGKGLSEALIKKAAHRISIPRYGQAESLNAAMATGILLSLFRRQ
ncbi:MAG: RNA methyltransferase [Chitinophagales bacterium]|nr:RNA methyltransferase [Chitinophagales bacterium]